MLCEDSDQLPHLSRLIILRWPLWILGYPQCALWRLWSASTSEQTDHFSLSAMDPWIPTVCSVKTLISLHIWTDWSFFTVRYGSLDTHSVLCKESDQLPHLRRLIILRSLLWILGYPQCALWRLWSASTSEHWSFFTVRYGSLDTQSVLCEDSDQPPHLSRLIILRCPLWILGYPQCALWRLWSASTSDHFSLFAMDPWIPTVCSVKTLISFHI